MCTTGNLWSYQRILRVKNIGINLFATLDSISEKDFAVVELSSFQLMKLSKSPDIAVVTNVAPNHLDWHKDMQEYVDAKKRIFAFQNPLERRILQPLPLLDFPEQRYSACRTF